MFNSTHTLVGVAVVRCGLGRDVPKAVWVSVIAANLPDLDIVAQLAGTPSYLEHHRGFTHTLIGIPILSLALALLAKWWLDRQAKRPIPLSTMLTLVLVSMLTHPLLDYTNTYGVRPFAPLNSQWFYGDALFIIDPVLDGILVAGLLLPRLFRHQRLIVVAALVAASSYILLRTQLRNDARQLLERYTAGDTGVRFAVTPHILNPFRWTGIIQNGGHLRSVRLHSSRGVEAEIARIEVSPDDEAIRRARQTRAASALLGFARFPGVISDVTPDGYEVRFFDFRFYRAGTGTAFVATVVLDRDLNVVSEDLTFTGAIRKR